MSQAHQVSIRTQLYRIHHFEGKWSSSKTFQPFTLQLATSSFNMATTNGPIGEEHAHSTSVGSLPSGRQRDQYEDVFVDPLPDYLKCPICLCCLSNPYQVRSVFVSASLDISDYLDRLHVVTDFARSASCPS